MFPRLLPLPTLLLAVLPALGLAAFGASHHRRNGGQSQQGRLVVGADLSTFAVTTSDAGPVDAKATSGTCQVGQHVVVSK